MACFDMAFRLKAQLEEVCGPDNKWYCARYYGRPITDHEILLRYFVKFGGAEDFARRYREAMGPVNRWHCSRHYCYDVRDERILWHYYMANRCPSSVETDRPEKEKPQAGCRELVLV